LKKDNFIAPPKSRFQAPINSSRQTDSFHSMSESTSSRGFSSIIAKAKAEKEARELKQQLEKKKAALAKKQALDKKKRQEKAE